MHRRHSIIVSNPSADSFSMSIAQRYAKVVGKAGDTAVIRDLYRLGFDPVLSRGEIEGREPEDVTQEKTALAGTDVFVLVYPIWFGTPPAMLKGYIERVLAAGYTYREMKLHRPQPMLENKLLISFTTSGSLRVWLEEKGVMMSLQNLFDHYLADVFGLRATKHYHFDGVNAEAKAWEFGMHLKDVEEAARNVLTMIDASRPRELAGVQATR